MASGVDTHIHIHRHTDFPDKSNFKKTRPQADISPTAVRSLYMALAVDIINGCGLSNKARGCICCSFYSKSPLTSCTLLTIRSASVLKVGMPCAS